MAYRRILVPVDGSDASREALSAAIDLARTSGGHVRLLHVLDEMAYLSSYEFSAPVIQEVRQQAGDFMKTMAKDCESSGVAHDTRLVDRPGSRLGQVVADEAAQWDADLVVVGSHGRRGLDRFLLGSGAEQVIRCAEVPVLVVRGRDAAR